MESWFLLLLFLADHHCVNAKLKVAPATAAPTAVAINLPEPSPDEEAIADTNAKGGNNRIPDLFNVAVRQRQERLEEQRNVAVGVVDCDVWSFWKDHSDNRNRQANKQTDNVFCRLCLCLHRIPIRHLLKANPYSDDLDFFCCF